MLTYTLEFLVVVFVALLISLIHTCNTNEDAVGFYQDSKTGYCYPQYPIIDPLTGNILRIETITSEKIPCR